MSASRRRHSEQLALPDEEPAVRHDPRLRQQPLVRTRSSAHLFLGQLTGTCSSLLRRLSVKVRYLSLSLIPGAGAGSSRPTTPARRHRPQSADRVEESSDHRTGRTRPRRHTTTVLTMDESTPVARHGTPDPTDLTARQLQRTTTRGHSPSPDTDSEATPTPSPCTVPLPVTALEESGYPGSGQQHLRTDDYPTLKGSSTSRRRRRHHQNSNSNSSSGSSNGSGVGPINNNNNHNTNNNNNNNNNYHQHYHHHRKSLAEASTGRDQVSPALEKNDANDVDHQFELSPCSSSTATTTTTTMNATPLALDQCFALGLNLTTLAPSTDTYLAGDQETDAAGSSALCDDQSERPEFELTNNNSDGNSGNNQQNPYFDWFLSCNLDEPATVEQETSLLERRPSSSKSSHRSTDSERGQPFESERGLLFEPQSSLEDLPYPILLDDWISPPSPPSPVLQEPSGDSSMDPDPLSALRHHSTWFEEYAYPAYTSKSSNQASSKSSNRLSATGSASGSGRMMAEKAYPYVSSPASPRHSNKYQQASPYDPYDLLYDESSYLALPETGKSFKVSSSLSSNIIPVPSGDKSNNNSERGVHPGPESLPGVEPATRTHGPSSSTTSSSATAKMPSSSSIMAAGQHHQLSSASASTTRTVRHQPLGRAS